MKHSEETNIRNRQNQKESFGFFFKKIAPDKWKHFFVGIAMGIVLLALFWYVLPEHHLRAVLISFTLVAAISYGFELFSLVTGWGHYEAMDAVAAVLGGVIGMGSTMLVLIIK